MSSKPSKRNSSTNYTSNPITIEELPLALPPRDTPLPPGHKTLIDIINDKRPRDSSGNPILPSTSRRRKSPQEANTEPEEEEDVETEEIDAEKLIGPLGTSIFHTVPTIFLLAAFEVVVHQQYTQQISVPEIAIKCLKAFPIFLTLIYTIHPHRLNRLVQFCFLVFSVAAGCWVVHATNRLGYYNVMKRAPPLGALWVWSAAEMELPWLVASCAMVGGWVWWGGYEIV